MKKLVFMFVAVAAISFASCGNKAAEAPVEEETVDTAVVDTVDTVDVDTTEAVEVAE